MNKYNIKEKIINKSLNIFGYHSNKQRFPKDVFNVNLNQLGQISKFFSSNNNPNNFPTSIYQNCDFLFQANPNKCLDTCVKMLISYHLQNQGKNEFRIKDAHYNEIINLIEKLDKKRSFYEGLDWEIILNAFNKKLFKEIPISQNIKSKRIYTTSQLAYMIYHFGPLIINMKFSILIDHALLLVGVYHNTLIAHDPWYGPNQFIHIRTFNENISKENPAFVYFRDLFKLDEPYEIPITKFLVNL
jgi:hypothetical protein